MLVFLNNLDKIKSVSCMEKMTNIIVSDLSFDSKDEYDIIRSNISFINLLLEEGEREPTKSWSTKMLF